MSAELVFAPPRRPKPPRHLADLSPVERREVAVELGLPGYRADQVARHYFVRLAENPDDMTDLPANVRGKLTETLLPRLIEPIEELSADGGTTRKSVLRLFDGVLVESVLMRYPDRATMCVSSQAGCGMNCPFCATGQQGLTRQSVYRRDRRSSRGGGTSTSARGDPRRPDAIEQRRTHGHGRAVG